MAHSARKTERLAGVFLEVSRINKDLSNDWFEQAAEHNVRRAWQDEIMDTRTKHFKSLNIRIAPTSRQTFVLAALFADQHDADEFYKKMEMYTSHPDSTRTDLYQADASTAPYVASSAYKN